MLVQELVKLDKFCSLARLVAGSEGLYNRISNITVMEAPDFPSWVNGEEFVLSTFYSIKDNPELQVETIRRLSEKGVGAVGIKVGRYIDSLSQQMLETADSLKLPLFAIDREVKFRDIIRIVSQEIINRGQELQQQTFLFSETLHNMALQRASLESFCETIERQIGYACAIYEANRHRLAGRVVREEGRAGTGSERGDGVDEIWDHMALRLSWSVRDSLEFRQESFVIVGCYVKQELTGLLVFSGVENWGVRESTLAQIAASAVGLRLLEDYFQRKVETRMIASFFEEVLFKGLSQNAFFERAKFFGWQTFDRFQAIVFRLSGICLEPHAFQMLADRWTIRLRERFASVLTMVRNTDLITLVSVPSTSKWIDKAYHRKQMEELLEGLFYGSRLKPYIRVGIGLMFDDPAMIANSYRQAVSLVEFDGGKGMLKYADDYILQIFLLNTKDQFERRWIRNNVWGPLQEYDEKHGTELIKTLKVFISYDSIEEAADKLHIHPNTLRKRLSKVEEITGIPPTRTFGKLLLLTASIEQI